MPVEIWSDVVCPWCYIGKRRFERAVASFGHPVEVVHTACGSAAAAALVCSACGELVSATDVSVAPGPGRSAGLLSRRARAATQPA